MREFEIESVVTKDKRMNSIAYIFEAESDLSAKKVFEDYVTGYVTRLVTKNTTPYFNIFRLAWVMKNEIEIVLKERGSRSKLASISFEELKRRIEAYKEKFEKGELK